MRAPHKKGLAHFLEIIGNVLLYHCLAISWSAAWNGQYPAFKNLYFSHIFSPTPRMMESMGEIALDVMGGDFAPDATVRAAARFSLKSFTHTLHLFGDESRIHQILKQIPHDAEKLSIHHTDSWVPMDANPKDVARQYAASSLFLAAQHVADKKAQAIVSAGNTGAVVMACSTHFKRLPGIKRCALGAVYPTHKRHGTTNDPFSLILDAGLTLQADMHTLVGFAVMGAAYAKCISKNPVPKVALLSNGTEPSKGPPSVVEAHCALKESLESERGFEFIGNIEGLDIPKGTADVVITDGFTGNIVLKMLEGVVETVRHLATNAKKQNIAYLAGLTLLYPAVKELKALTDWQQYGGAPLLGYDALCIKAHGRSKERAIYNALKVAHRTIEEQLTESIVSLLGAAVRES